MDLMRTCPVCSNPASADLGELSNTKIAPLERTEYRLLQCHDCDIVYLSPLPTVRDLDILYIDELQFDYHDDEHARVIVDFMANRLRAVLARMAASDVNAVLEIGAGPAWMARAAKQVSPQARTVAQDVTKEVADKCPWVDDYIVASADDPQLDSLGPYDVISLTHVIEHLPDPIAMLRRLRSVTRGMIFMTAPHRPVRWDGTIESWRKYSYNHVPAHLQYFSERGMQRMAEAAGFKIAYWDATSEDGQAFETWLKPDVV
jgi:trans-aconitate methyltransferase